jgi:demethylmenaquinone methyltransferase / 2-methoxy-6-polyprenyl-1,4-benzoquinol methylase
MVSRAGKAAERFFAGNGDTYDRIADLSTLGLDRLWKRAILAEIPAEPRRIVDQACGTGILTFQIARRFPGCHVTGVDLQDGYLEVARRKARDLRLDNVDLVLGRAEEVVLPAGVDCITSAYLAKYADLDRLVASAGRMLRAGGVLVAQDFTYPARPAFAAIWRLHLELLQTLGARSYPEWAVAFRELPALLKESRWVEELTSTLEAHRFSDIQVRSFFLGASAMVTARAPGAASGA